MSSKLYTQVTQSIALPAMIKLVNKHSKSHCDVGFPIKYFYWATQKCEHGYSFKSNVKTQINAYTALLSSRTPTSQRVLKVAKSLGTPVISERSRLNSTFSGLLVVYYDAVLKLPHVNNHNCEHSNCISFHFDLHCLRAHKHSLHQIPYAELGGNLNNGQSCDELSPHSPHRVLTATKWHGTLLPSGTKTQ